MIMAAARHPELQAKVQAQLDEVVGRDRRKAVFGILEADYMLSIPIM